MKSTTSEDTANVGLMISDKLVVGSTSKLREADAPVMSAKAEDTVIVESILAIDSDDVDTPNSMEDSTGAAKVCVTIGASLKGPEGNAGSEAELIGVNVLIGSIAAVEVCITAVELLNRPDEKAGMEARPDERAGIEARPDERAGTEAVIVGTDVVVRGQVIAESGIRFRRVQPGTVAPAVNRAKICEAVEQNLARPPKNALLAHTSGIPEALAEALNVVEISPVMAEDPKAENATPISTDTRRPDSALKRPSTIVNSWACLQEFTMLASGPRNC